MFDALQKRAKHKRESVMELKFKKLPWLLQLYATCHGSGLMTSAYKWLLTYII
jgi:hypothetical protein